VATHGGLRQTRAFERWHGPFDGLRARDLRNGMGRVVREPLLAHGRQRRLALGRRPVLRHLEYAAAGGSEERAYPWGSQDPGVTNQFANGCARGYGACTIQPVGGSPSGAGSWGQLDLAGNVWQWTLDSYASYASPCVDCAYLPQPPFQQVYRGGGYNHSDCEDQALSPAERCDEGYYDSPDIGFRCARSP
jgi:sulfatase modifying factor 1